MSKTVEALCAGHSDKICDQIADGIVDEYLRRDPDSRLDIKVLGSHGMVMVGGEVNSTADFDVASLAKQMYHEIGYSDEIEVFVNIESSSEEIKKIHGSYDTVVVNGYATRETREFLPLPMVLAQGLVRRLDDLRRLDPSFHWLGADGKAQVVMEGKKVSAVTLLASHAADVAPIDVQARLLERVVAPIIGGEQAQIFINPIGQFSTQGFQSEAGVSGRRAAADFYGGLVPHGDSSPIGKDPQRAERAGAYMARYVAKQLVKEGKADSAVVSLTYTLGRSEPVMIDVKSSNPSPQPSPSEGGGTLLEYVKQNYNFNLDDIVEKMDLKKPRYRAVSVYGQFGREGLPWE
ncbi:MAG: methionine adenosyltransferase domain-containing protein [Patescibacteria group bacterium]|jgi:S-adenosylmethionine synthetase